MKKIIFILAMFICPNLFAATLTANIVPYTCQGGTTPQLCDSNLTTSSGFTGVGTNTPSQRLDVNGNLFIEGSNYIGFNSTNNAIYASSTALIFNAANNQELVIDGGANDVYTNGWSNYTASSTIVGWSSFSVESIYTKKIGKTVFVSVDLEGVSNSTSASFTVPYAAASTPSYSPFAWEEDAYTFITGGYFQTSNLSTTITLSKNATVGNNWTASGGKSVVGSFWYQSN